jgi:hypothetical protein
MAEVRPDEGKATSSGAARLSCSPFFGCQGVGYDRISLRRRTNEAEIMPNSPGIWGMSAKASTREEDMTHCQYHPITQCKMPAGLG